MKNYSKQREEIVRTLYDMNSCPTAEELYMVVKAKNSLISRSTVYRNLNGLVEEGRLKRIATGFGTDRFDCVSEGKSHAVCVKCGKVFAFDSKDDLKKLKKDVLEKTGVNVFNSGFTVQGICEACQNK
jgi:Fe2+ or Zn2+ uptake regulation protein